MGKAVAAAILSPGAGPRARRCQASDDTDEAKLANVAQGLNQTSPAGHDGCATVTSGPGYGAPWRVTAGQRSRADSAGLAGL